MKINLNKNKFTEIEAAFLILMEDHHNPVSINIIKQSLESCFGCQFNINIIESEHNSSLFIMSVFPEISVIDKIISSVMSNESDSKAIKKLWETNKVWTIEIDSRILDKSFIECSEKELTAMLLHEVGHIVFSTSIPNRISIILKYEIIKTKSSNKMMLKDKIFRRILSLPILDACISDGKRDRTSIKEELKADEFVKKMGYVKYLSSVLSKLLNTKMYKNTDTIDMKISKDSRFALSTLEEFQQRKNNLVKNKFLSLKENCSSPYIIDNVIKSFIDIFEETDNTTLCDGQKLLYFQEKADKCIEDGYYTEFFLFKKNLKRVDPAEIDYIDIKINEIKNENDKMMILSYIHHKMDIVDYYISILQDDKTSSKYNIPHTLQQLKEMKKRLNHLREVALKYRIPDKYRGILVKWPTGYEG